MIRPLFWSILAAMAVYAGGVVFTDLGGVGESVVRLNLAGWVVILALSLFNYGIRFVRWEFYLHRLSSRISTLRSLAYYLGGFAFTTTPGKAGEAVRSLYLKRHGVAYVHSLAAFFTERFVDLVAMVLLALFAALAFPEYRQPVLLIAVIIVVLLPLIHLRSVHGFLERRLRKLPSEKVRVAGMKFLGLLGSSSLLLRSGTLFAGVALALVAWGAEGVAFHVILGALALETSLELTIGIYSVSVLAGALSFIPGGLGSTEAVMILLLKLIGADTSTAVAATLICRVATLWFAVMIGCFALVAVELGGKSARFQAPSL